MAKIEAGDDGRPNFYARKACNYLTEGIQVCMSQLIGECYTEQKVNEMEEHQMTTVLQNIQSTISDWDSSKCPAIKSQMGGPQDNTGEYKEEDGEGEAQEGGEGEEVEEEGENTNEEGGEEADGGQGEPEQGGDEGETADNGEDGEGEEPEAEGESNDDGEAGEGGDTGAEEESQDGSEAGEGGQDGEDEGENEEDPDTEDTPALGGVSGLMVTPALMLAVFLL